MELRRVRWSAFAWCMALALGVAIYQAVPVPGQGRRSPSEVRGPLDRLSIVQGRPTDRSATLSILSAVALDAYVEYGKKPGQFTSRTPRVPVAPGDPLEIAISDLSPGALYHYRLRTRNPGDAAFEVRAEGTIQTQRQPGTAFTFAVQGDSHPERAGRMFDPVLYAMTLKRAAEARPDFYITMGDDFSIEKLIDRDELSQAAVNAVYAAQRGYLGLVGGSAALFLVNGNHEQAGRHWLDGTANNPALLAGVARTRYYPLPAPGSFYSGDAEKAPGIGLLRDYYAWTWGDALFVVIDPYWHSPVGPDDGLSGGMAAREAMDPPNGGGKRAGRGRGGRDLWQVTLGDAQYRWLSETLTRSKARFKFVFAHHVLGTGRGGVEEAGLYEWGGKDRRGVDQWKDRRPNMAEPIHQLMARTGVTIFFQGHDHLYARQELDGVVYQSMPAPADPTYTAFNRDAYRSGDVVPNSGHVRVHVSPTEVKVEYVRSFLPVDGKAPEGDGKVAASYTIQAAKPRDKP